jgi:hypothetical protein
MWLFAAALFILLDFQNLLALWRGWVLEISEETSRDFTLVVPVYGHPRYLRNLDFLSTLRENVVIAVDVGERVMEGYAEHLVREGWRVHTTDLGKIVGPDSIIHAVLMDGAVTTKWLVRMDADTYATDDLGKAVAAAERADAHMCSVKCLVARPENLVETLQQVEYAMAMRTRHFRPWMTSGACIIGTTDAYRTVLLRHTLSFGTWGGDIETGQIANSLRMKVRHIDFPVYTEAPSTWRALFKQRMVWWASGFRAVVINIDSALRMPLYLVYYLGLVWLGAYWRLGGGLHLGSVPYYIPTLLLLYTAICFATNWPVRSRWMLLFPYYSLLQVTLMPAVGAVRCVTYVVKHRKNPRFKLGFRRGRYVAPGLGPA